MNTNAAYTETESRLNILLGHFCFAGRLQHSV